MAAQNRAFHAVRAASYSASTSNLYSAGNERRRARSGTWGSDWSATASGCPAPAGAVRTVISGNFVFPALSQ